MLQGMDTLPNQPPPKTVQADSPLDDQFWEAELPRLRERLLAYLLKRRIAQDLAEDVVQDALWRIWKNRARVEGMRAVPAFSTVVLRNALRSAVVRRPASAALAEEPKAASDDPLRKLMLAEFRDWVATEIESLSPRQQTALLGRHVHQEEVAVVCARLGTSPDVLKRVVHRGLRKLRESAMAARGQRFVGLLDAE